MTKVLSRLCISSMLLLLAFTTSVQAEEDTKTVPVIEIVDPTYDFGEARSGEPVGHDFTVLNKGTAPLEIRRVQTG